ncbi:MAG: hypothetical protein NT062_36140, partial [Proteobacteria bacterium]|nr:hypothetical protein [Pseudomonadota bacterium]
MTRTAGHVYTIGLGLIGWAAVIALPLLGVESTRLDALAIGMFVVVILATRSLAFKPTSGTVLSLDSVY